VPHALVDHRARSLSAGWRGGFFGGTPARAAGLITQISHATFTAGMHNAFLVGAAVALAGAGIALITRKGTGTGAAHAGI
jgi:hypothetical protein